MPSNLANSSNAPLTTDSADADLAVPLADAPVNPGPDRHGSRLMSRLLPPAIRLWLHTQLDRLEGLDFVINGQDRQILSGYVPQVCLSARQAVYRGLQVSQVTVTAAGIHVNLGQVLRGKPLRLLQPFPVRGQVSLSREDVRASLQAPLLAQALADVFQRLVQVQPEHTLGEPAIAALTSGLQFTQLRDIVLGQGQINLIWQLSETLDERLHLQTNLEIREGRWLCLCQPIVSLYRATTWSAPTVLEEVVMDLGSEAIIERLGVTDDAIELAGAVRVIPATENQTH